MNRADIQETVRYYTPKEANQALPLVKRIVQDIQETAKRIRQIAEERGADAQEDADVRRLVADLNGFVVELERLGVSYKDPQFSVGLVDFPSLIDGEEVLLCWRSDEESVAYYHGLRAGYAGRKPIPKAYLEAE